jgi:transcriptional regulator with XRE-family HTH domain
MAVRHRPRAIVAISQLACEFAGMDRRVLSALFRERLKALIAREDGGLARFAREAGVDRSALSQFLDPDIDRLPRAETLRALAAARGVTADWLLGLSNAPEGGAALARSVEIEMAEFADGGTPLVRWRREAAGAKVRYVPAGLPDVLLLPEVIRYEHEGARADARIENAADMLAGAEAGDLDVEIALPAQRLTDFARGAGVWGGLAPAARLRQIDRMAEIARALYPTLRVHLYDGRRTFSAPFTVFGAMRAAIYLGRAYLVLTAADQVRAMARHFDGLVREAVVSPDRAADAIARAGAAAATGDAPDR